MRFVLRAFLRVIEFLMGVVLWSVVLALLVRFALLVYPHHERLPLVSEVRRTVDDLLGEIGSWVGIAWPSATLPGLALAVVIGILACGVLGFLRIQVKRARIAISLAGGRKALLRRVKTDPRLGRES